MTLTDAAGKTALDHHRDAESWMGRADMAQTKRDRRNAWRLAADAEVRCFPLIPADRPRTRGIIAISAVALMRNSGAVDEALRLVEEFRPHVPEWASHDLDQLFEEGWQNDAPD